MSKFTEPLILLYNRTGWPLIIEDSIAFYEYPIALNEFRRDFGIVQKIISTVWIIWYFHGHIGCNAAKEVKSANNRYVIFLDLDEDTVTV